ncbi:MAG: PAS domain-containing protein [Proteobacteria bacterium]|nr:PAS domain-containing protein [Pseudomonadota bacterium]MDA1064541.1 PAS domain-containing protein [Pseudomonadota bacterium]
MPRRLRNQDKLNYELNIGARKFKCTTIPIYRENCGLVGAICINVDANYLQEEVRRTPENVAAFINALCKTDMQLEENILSKDEYEKALAGKRHFRDFSTSPLMAT